MHLRDSPRPRLCARAFQVSVRCSQSVYTAEREPQESDKDGVLESCELDETVEGPVANTVSPSLGEKRNFR